VPNTTDVALLEPGDEGYIEGEDTPQTERYHEVPFPGMAVDSRHFFRVRSTNKAGKTLESEVYSVYITGTVVLESKNGPAIQVAIEPVEVTEQQDVLSFTNESSLTASAEPEGAGELLGIKQQMENVAVTEPNSPTNTQFETNITTTVA
jgi:hypothetical protein